MVLGCNIAFPNQHTRARLSYNSSRSNSLRGFPASSPTLSDIADTTTTFSLPTLLKRSKVAANAEKRPKSSIPPDLQETVGRVEKVSLGWAKLIARIYEVNPLLCSCGKEMKIITFVTHSAEIRRILSGIGWPTEIPEFDPPYDLPDRDICQLLYCGRHQGLICGCIFFRLAIS